MWPWSPSSSRIFLLKSRPKAIAHRPDTAPTTIEVCTACEVFSGLLSPMDLATMTLAPTAKPVNRFSMQFTIADVVPIAPIAPSTCDSPTVIMSAAL